MRQHLEPWHCLNEQVTRVDRTTRRPAHEGRAGLFVVRENGWSEDLERITGLPLPANGLRAAIDARVADKSHADEGQDLHL